MAIITVFHTTSLGTGKLIVKKGWLVEERPGVRNIFGRGIYFWELIDDAHTYGKAYFGANKYEILAEQLPVTLTNSVIYDYNEVRSFNWDAIAKGLLSRGIDVLIIPNPIMEIATLPRAKGKAYVWLVDIGQPKRYVRV